MISPLKNCIINKKTIFVEERFTLIKEIRSIIEEEYKAIEVYDAPAANFTVLSYHKGNGTPQEFLEIVYQMIDTARNMPTMPYVDVSEKQQEEITKTERMVKILHQNVQNHMENFRIVIQPAVFTGTKKFGRRRVSGALELSRQGCVAE